MDDQLWMGIDLGTQSVKVSIIRSDGLVRARSAASLTSVRTADTHEQHPAEWVRQTGIAMAAATNSLTTHERTLIAGVAICATSGTITTVDQFGAALSAGVMYDDARAASLSDVVVAADPPLWSRLGYRIQPTWALPKILWLARAGALTPGCTVATQADVIAAAIIGGPVQSDWSHSLKSGYDLVKLEWPRHALDVLGLAEDLFPNVVAPGTVLGVSSVAWHETTGLPSGTPVFAGMTDGCAAQLGSGTLALGDWHTVIGTTLVTKTVSDRLVVDTTGAIYSHRGPARDTWFPGGASNVGAGILSVFLPGDDLAARTLRVAESFDQRLEAIPLSYPLSGAGERFPISKPDARGFVQVGDGWLPVASAASMLGDDTLLASLLLGIACVERLAVDTMTGAGVKVNGRFTSSGGATRNSWFTQLRADLLGRPISIPVSAEGSLGMAILAAWSAMRKSDDRIELAEMAARMSPLSDPFEPDAANHQKLEQTYGRFRSELTSRGWLST